MPTLENYSRAICRLKRHYVEALCKVETISPPGRPFTLEMLNDRRSVASALRVAISKISAIATLLGNEIRDGNGESTDPSLEIESAVGELFACLLTDETSVHFATLDAFGKQLEERSGYAYTFGIRVLNYTGSKQPDCLRFISVAITGAPVDIPTGEECKLAHEGPYTPDFPWSNTLASSVTGVSGIEAVRGCTNSLSQYDTEAVASQLVSWAQDRLCCTTNVDQWEEILNQKDVIYALFLACNVCKVTLRNLPLNLTGWKLEYTDGSTNDADNGDDGDDGDAGNGDASVEKTVFLSDVDSRLIVNRVYCDYISDTWAEDIDLKIVAGNGQGLPGPNPVTIANTTQCRNREEWRTECLKVALKPELDFVPYFVNCDKEIIADPINTGTLKDPICDEYEFTLPMVTTGPEDLEVTVTIVFAPNGCPSNGDDGDDADDGDGNDGDEGDGDGNDGDDGDDGDDVNGVAATRAINVPPVVAKPGDTIKLPFGTYCATYSATDECGTATCNQTIIVREVVKPTVVAHDQIQVVLTTITVNGNDVNEGLLYAIDLDNGSSDNCTSPEDLVFLAALVVNDEVVGEPSDCLVFNEPGEQTVRLFVTDGAGNTNFVDVTVVIKPCPIQ